MSDPVTPKPNNGWKPWAWVKAPNVPTSVAALSTSATTSGAITFQDNASFGIIPDKYLPSQNLWIQASVAHCVVPLPWTFNDPFQDFLTVTAAGGFSTIGAVAGLATAQADMAEPSEAKWGLSYPNYDTPRLGYCVGTVLKEDLYTVMSATKVSTLFMPEGVNEIHEDIMWRSKFKRMYLYQGEILSMQRVMVNGIPDLKQYVMDLGVGRKVITPITLDKTFTVKKYTTSGTTNTPVSYVGKIKSVNADGKCLIVFGSDTTQVIPGDYYELEKAICLEDPYLIDGFWLGNENENHLTGNSGLNLYGTESNRPYISGKFEILYPLSTSITRIKLVDGGGSPSYCNFHHPCLKNQYLKNDGVFFKIKDQFDGNVIDVNSTSVDGSKTLNVTKEYSIINHFAWMINEYYMTDAKNNIFTGKIKSVTANTATTTETEFVITVDGENSSTWVNLQPKNYKPTYLPVKSFINRFYKEYVPVNVNNEPIKCWSKYQDWQININSNVYSVKSISIPTFNTVVDGQSYDMSVKLTSKTDGLVVGQKTYISFDKKYLIDGNFNGLLFMELKQTYKKGQAFASLCMNGYWLSPKFVNSFGKDNKYIGTCNGRYFGASDEVAISNSLATFFVTVKGVANGLSSLYHDVKFDEWVAYLDQYSNTLTLRQGTIDFSEDPRKIEVSIGRSAYQESGTGYTGTSFTPSSRYNRIKNLSFTVPDVDLTSELPTLFTIGSNTDYFGFLISGNGDMNLNGLNQYSTNNLPKNYKFKGNYVSPVYTYKNGQMSSQKRTNLHIGMETKLGTINTNGTTLTNALAEYVNNNQVLADISFFDVFYLKDGEPIVIYGQSSEAFSLTSGTTTYLNNSNLVTTAGATSASTWKYSSNCVMIAGSTSDGDTWGCPLVKDMSGDFQYPLMILNSVDYLASIYDEVANMIIMVARCYNNDGRQYIGCFGFDINSFNYKNFLCTPVSKIIMTDKFWFRPFAKKDEFYTGDFAHIPVGNKVLCGYSLITDNSTITPMDNFVRVMGSNIVNVNVNTNMTIYDIISLYLFDTGLLVMLFASDDGLHALYSHSKGSSWVLSGILLSDNASSGSIISGRLFYINSSGIFTKSMEGVRLGETIAVPVGDPNVSSSQLEINGSTSINIVSDSLPNQRLSGYRTVTGMYKVFFYDQNGILSCVQGVENDWEIAPNF